MRRFWLFLVLLCACATLLAQTFSLQTGRQPVASLDGLWRFQTGDNPAWADPNFDDSKWPLLRSDEDWAKQGYRDYSGFAWYRFQIVVPPGTGDISLWLPPVMTSYQVFVDGKLAKTVGQMPPHARGIHPVPAIVPLPVSEEQRSQPILIALRIWHWPAWARYYGGGPTSGGSIAGQSHLIQAHASFVHNSALLENGGAYTIDIAEGIAGLLALLLFLIRRTEREYLWFACLELTGALTGVYNTYAALYPVGIDVRDLLHGALDAATLLFMIAFLVTLLRARRTLLLYMAIAAPLLIMVNSIAIALYHFYPAGDANVINACLRTIFSVWAADLLIRKAKEGFPDARLLLAPVLIALGLNPVEGISVAGFQLGWLKTRHTHFYVFRHPFGFTLDDAVQILFLLAMLAILINRFARTRREEQRIAGELEAARSMQSLLIPATPPATPGFSVETVYLPASEVGGDFFQVLPGPDNSLLIVVGDVSGKGLKAAMTVSAIIGALRGCSMRKPSDVLSYLNQILHGQITGFVTCSAAFIAADGAMTLANAGNLPPYCNGKELAIESSLPLGITADVTYSESSFQLNPSDRLAFVSDGVVEATNEQRELFGFDRTQAISSQSAAQIAAAAKSFGQQDDISVLSVTLAPALKETLV